MFCSEDEEYMYIYIYMCRFLFFLFHIAFLTHKMLDFIEFVTGKLCVDVCDAVIA